MLAGASVKTRELNAHDRTLHPCCGTTKERASSLYMQLNGEQLAADEDKRAAAGGQALHEPVPSIRIHHSRAHTMK